MLDQIVARSQRCRSVDDVVIATTTDPTDDELVDHCRAAGLACSRGPVDDIVQRVVDAGRLVSASVVVRIWGDCPFIDPEVIDDVVLRFIAERADYGSISLGGRTFPVGLDFEVYRMDLLTEILRDTADPFFREFPFEYVGSVSERLQVVSKRSDADLSQVNLTVDYPEDLALARELYRRLPAGFGYRDIMEILREIDARPQMPRNIEYLQKKRERNG